MVIGRVQLGKLCPGNKCVRFFLRPLFSKSIRAPDNVNATGKDRDILARTLYGDGFEDQIALASTIRKRVFDGQAVSW